MMNMSRRWAIRGSLSAVAVTPLARPYIANAQAKTAIYWAGQGFIPQEDAAMRKVCEDYMKQSGNTIDFSLIPFAPLNQKTVSALTSGDVPDIIDINTDVLAPQNAWDDKMVEVSDVVDTQKDAYHPTVYLATQSTTARRRSAARTLCRTRPRSFPSTSGIRWWRKPGSSCPTRRRHGMRSGISSSRCRRSCAISACATFTR